MVSYRWTNGLCHVLCFCGWRGAPAHTRDAAKGLYLAHVRDDCPIGDRKPRA